MKARILPAVILVAFVFSAPMPAQAPAGKGYEVLKAAAAATGGDAVSKVKSLEMKGVGTVNSVMGTADLEITMRVSFPDKLRVISQIPAFGEVQQGFDGKSGWGASPQGTMDAPADFNTEYLRGIALTGGIGIYQQVAGGTAQAEFAGEKEFDGKKSLCVEWMAPSGKVKLYFDAESKLLIGAQYTARLPQGDVAEERRWSDFKAIDGVQLPTHLRTYRDGGLYTDITLKEIKVNPPLDEAAFKKP